jgi:hypothetical protein
LSGFGSEPYSNGIVVEDIYDLVRRFYIVFKQNTADSGAITQNSPESGEYAESTQAGVPAL